MCLPSSECACHALQVSGKVNVNKGTLRLSTEMGRVLVISQ